MAASIYKKDTPDEGSSQQYLGTGSGSGSYLGKSIEIKGEISAEEYLTIEGKVTGNITSNKKLTIGSNGFVKGKMDAQEVRIDGKVEGIIHAAGKLEISRGGIFSGSMKADKLVIEEGALFKGKVNVDESQNE